jgi:hypothetical protein
MQQAKELREGVGGAAVNAQAETVIATVTGVSTGVGHSQVFLEALAVLTTTAGAVKVTLRIRREGVAGVEVAKVVTTPTKSAEQTTAFQCQDTPAGEVANMSYVLTAESSVAENQVSVNSRITATF